MATQPNLENLMKEAQKLQEKMQAAQDELARLEVIGESGGGMVKVTMTGKYDVKKVDFDDDLMDEDKDIIQDLFAAAVNDAVRKVGAASKTQISKLTEGMQLPTDIDTGGTGGGTDA